MWRRSISLALLAAAVAFAAGYSTLVLSVRPEAALMWMGADAVRLKIRLAPGAQARLWGDASCVAPAADAYVVARSGTYVIPVSSIPNSNSGNICLASSDGALSRTLPVASR